MRFQSTRPARGATAALAEIAEVIGYFNPRAPRGARRRNYQLPVSGFYISIHAPRAGRDLRLRRSRR